MRIAGDLWFLWYICGLRSEGQCWMSALLAADTEPSPDRVSALWVSGHMSLINGAVPDGSAVPAGFALLDECRGLADISVTRPPSPMPSSSEVSASSTWVGASTPLGLVGRGACATGDRGVVAAITALGMELMRRAAPGHVGLVRELVVDAPTQQQVGVLAEGFAEVQRRVHGLPSGDFVPALEQFLGSSAGPVPGTARPMSQAWSKERRTPTVRLGSTRHSRRRYRQIADHCPPARTALL